MVSAKAVEERDGQAKPLQDRPVDKELKRFRAETKAFLSMPREAAAKPHLLQDYEATSSRSRPA
jgi:hypothetical protein